VDRVKALPEAPDPVGVRPPRHLVAGTDLLTRAAVAASVAMTALTLAVGAFGLPGFASDGPAAHLPVTEAPAHVVVLAPDPGTGHAS
jgi:hypothetical protein